MKAKIVKIEKDSVVIKNSKDKFVTIPKKRLEFEYKLGDTIEIEKNGNTFYFLPTSSNTEENMLEAFWDDENEEHEPSKNSRKKSKNVKGIGGWLLFFVICMCLSLIVNVANSGQGISGSDCDLLNEAYNGFCNGIMPLMSIENIMNLIVFIAQVIAIILTLSKKKVAIKYNIVLLIASTLWVIIDTAWAISVVGQYNIPSSVADPLINKVSGAAFGSVVACCIWAPYFLKSERVKNTLTK